MRCYQDFEVLITQISDRNIRVFSGASDFPLHVRYNGRSEGAVYSQIQQSV